MSNRFTSLIVQLCQYPDTVRKAFDGRWPGYTKKSSISYTVQLQHVDLLGFDKKQENEVQERCLGQLRAAMSSS